MNGKALGLAGIALLLAVTGRPLEGQAGSTGSWAAWYGCWQVVGDPAAEGEVLCVLPGEDAVSARFATLAAGELGEETVVRADGVARPVEEGGCAGHERAFFSADRRRVFVRSEMTCSAAERVSTGVLAFVGSGDWVDAQALTVRGQHAARAIRYSALPASQIPAAVMAQLPRDQWLAQEAARLDASALLDIPAVAEASRNVAAPAVEALLAAGGTGFGLDSRALRELERNAVPPSTIDILVALSYPRRFAVREQAPRYDTAVPLGSASGSFRDRCFDVGSRFRRFDPDCYDPWGYDYYSRYDRYGYSPWGYDPYGWRLGGAPIVVIVDPREDAVRDGGSVVKGVGYTPGTTPATRAAAPRGSDSPAPAAAPSGTQSSTPAATSTPASRTGDGGSSEPTRTARPRDPAQ